MSRHTVQRRSLWACLALVTALACVRPAPRGAIVVVREPPPNRVEVIVVSPGPGHVWVPGFWRWERNDFLWTPGRWMVIRRGYHRWVPGYWRHHRRGWLWVEGRWK